MLIKLNSVKWTLSDGQTDTVREWNLNGNGNEKCTKDKMKLKDMTAHGVKNKGRVLQNDSGL